MRYWKISLLAICALFIAAPGFTHDSATTARDAYQVGYNQGYDHGSRDYRSGLDSEYDSLEFRTGISSDSYVNSWFRDGYRRGYKDGYFAHHYSESAIADYEPLSATIRNSHFVTVFTDDGFRGSMQELRLGRYPDLSGKWNDSIDSIQVHGSVRVILYDQRNFQGQELILEQDAENLSELNYGDRAASIIIEPR